MIKRDDDGVDDGLHPSPARRRGAALPGCNANVVEKNSK